MLSIDWLLVDPGCGFENLIRARLAGRKTLYVAPPTIGQVRAKAWEGLDVKFVSYLRVKKIEPDTIDTYDQILFTEIGINTREWKDYQVSQSKAVRGIIRLLRDYKGHILWRPKSGQETTYPILARVLERAVVVNGLDWLSIPPNFNFHRFENLIRWGRSRKTRKV